MKNIFLIFKEQILHLPMSFRLSMYYSKAQNAHKYLGSLWEFLDPFFQVAIYYIIFGIGMRRTSGIPGVPFLAWMIVGMASWYFVNNSYSDTLQSINSEVELVSKMKFPISIFPTIKIIQRLPSLITLLIVSVATLFYYGIDPSIYWIQLIYYFLASVIFVFGLGLLSATIIVVIPDMDNIIRTFLRMIFWISGVLWQIDSNSGFSARFFNLLEKINPFFYLVDGYRQAMIYKVWFWQQPNVMAIFWIEVLIILILATHVHLKFREQLIDYI